MAKSPARGADFVAKIVKDPKNPPATVMLTGFLGASSEPGHTRLYFDPHLSNYVEIPDDAILHTEEVPAQGGLGATHVWIRQDAQLIYGPAGSERPKGTFLEGPIMQAHMPAAAAAAAAAGGGGAAAIPNTLHLACQPSVVVICQSAFVHCRTPVAACPPSLHHPCLTLPAICHRTPITPCITPQCTFGPGCPPPTLQPHCPILSAPHACPSFGPCPSLAGCPSVGFCPDGPFGPGGPGGPVVQPADLAAAAPPQAAARAAPFTFVLAACQTSFVDNCGGGCAVGTVMALPTLQFHCRPTFHFHCPTRLNCPSVLAICQTQLPLNCNVTLGCHSVIDTCPTENQPHCPTAPCTLAWHVFTANCPIPSAVCGGGFPGGGFGG